MKDLFKLGYACLALFGAVAHALSTRGLAYLHVVEGNIAGKPDEPPSTFDYAALKAAFGGPYLANFNFDKARANAAIAAGKVDMVAFGKLFLANPDLVTRFLLDAPLNVPDAATFYGGDAAGYTDYPVVTAVAG